MLDLRTLLVILALGSSLPAWGISVVHQDARIQGGDPSFNRIQATSAASTVGMCGEPRPHRVCEAVFNHDHGNHDVLQASTPRPTGDDASSGPLVQLNLISSNQAQQFLEQRSVTLDQTSLYLTTLRLRL
ncbi:MAG: hypothetical protein OES46_19755 [Gammaproteobacteria bacterium]|nr:hypothetical protein [Gammaproteobacteria bacterium]